jgi:hypothetical protein
MRAGTWNLHIILIKNSPKYKLSKEASWLTPTKLKIVKRIQVWRERGSCVVCEVWEPSSSIYSHGLVGLAWIKLETSQNRLCMSPCNRRRRFGSGGNGGGAATPTHGVAAPRQAHQSFSSRLLGGPGSCPHRCLAQICKVGGLLCLFLFYALSESIFLSPFPPYSCICPVK